MAALQPTSNLTGAAVTEAQAKVWFSDLRDYLAGLLGTDGLPATARTALGIAGTIPTTSLSANTTLVAATHFGRVIRCTAGITVTLPTPAAAGDGWWGYVQMAGTAAVSIARGSTGDLITVAGGTQGGAASISVPGTAADGALWNVRTVRIQCDGTNWHVIASDATHGSKTFTSSTTWVCPQGVTRVLVTGSGGGGGGGAGYDDGGDGSANRTGGNGGNGGRRWRNQVSTVPGTTYTVTVGAGGAASTAGTATSLGALITLAAGSAGGAASSGSAGSAGSSGASDAAYPQPGGTNTGVGGLGASGIATPGAGVAGYLTLEW